MPNYSFRLDTTECPYCEKPLDKQPGCVKISGESSVSAFVDEHGFVATDPATHLILTDHEPAILCGHCNYLLPFEPVEETS